MQHWEIFIDTISEPLARLVAFEAIKRVKARYCRFLDTRDWPAFAALFTADAVMDVHEDTRREPVFGVDAIVAQVRFAVDHAATSQQVHSPEIDLTSGLTAHVK